MENFSHIWKTTMWGKCGKLFSTCGKLQCGKNVGKIPTCGKCMWKSGKHVENYVKKKMHKKACFFCAKGRTKIFLKKAEKKEGKQKQTVELLHCNV